MEDPCWVFASESVSSCPPLGVWPSEAESLGTEKCAMKGPAGPRAWGLPFLSQCSWETGGAGELHGPVLRYTSSGSWPLHLESWLCIDLLWAANYVQKIGAVVEDWKCLALYLPEPGSKSLPLLSSFLPESLKFPPGSVSLGQGSWPQFRFSVTSSKRGFGWLPKWKIVANGTIKDGKRTEASWGSGEVGLPGTL